MAEALGLAASVLSLAQTAFAVAKGLFDLADEVGSAGEAVRIFANDFSFFVETLKTLGGLLKNIPAVSRRAQSTAEELLDVALEQVVQPFQNLLSGLKPLLVRWRNSPARMKQLGLRLQWAFSYKRKVLFYHAALNALKSNVSLLLQAMSLRGQNPPHIRFIVCTSIEDTKATLQGGSYIHASRLLRSVNERIGDGRRVKRKPVRSSTSESIGGVIPPWSDSDFYNQRPPSTEMALVLLTNTDDPEDADKICDGLVGITLLEQDHTDNSPEDQAEHEEQLEAFGAIRAVQKKIVKLADEATTAAVPSPSDTMNGGNTAPLGSGGNATSWQEARDRASQQQKVNQPANLPRHLSVATQTGATKEVGEILHFVDPLGSTFEIPYRYVRTWQGMHAFVKAELSNVSHANLPISVHPLPAPDNPKSRSSKSASKTQWRKEKILQPPNISGTAMWDIWIAIKSQRFSILYSVYDGLSYNMVLPYDWESVVQAGGRVQLLLDNENLRAYRLEESCRVPSLGRIRKAQVAAIDAERNHGKIGGADYDDYSDDYSNDDDDDMMMWGNFGKIGSTKK